MTRKCFITLAVCSMAACFGEAPLANGVYAVVKTGPSAEQARTGADGERVMKYGGEYFALDASRFVPLILAEPPKAAQDDRGFTMLNVKLAPEHARRLETFTREHLGGRIAVVIGGDIVTTHKVRGVIRDGEAKITRCDDDACRTLLLKLTQPSEAKP